MAVMRRNGYEGATVEEILDEAGVSTRAFYRQFSAKDDLVAALYRREADTYSLKIEKRIKETDDPVQALSVYVDECLAVYFNPRRKQRAAIMRSAAAQRAAGFKDEMVRAEEVLVKPLEEVIRRGAAGGVYFSSTHPLVDARTIRAVVLSIGEGAARGDIGWPTSQADALTYVTGLAGKLLSVGRAGRAR